MKLDGLLAAAGAAVLEVDGHHPASARDEWTRYGPGAGLTFGDRFSCTAAGVSGEPLLFKGDDSTHTAIGRAL